MNFIRDFKEKINGLTDSSFIPDLLIMDDFNYSIRERQIHKPRLSDVRKNCNSEGCNSAENRSVRVNVVKQKRINIRLFVK